MACQGVRLGGVVVVVVELSYSGRGVLRPQARDSDRIQENSIFQSQERNRIYKLTAATMACTRLTEATHTLFMKREGVKFHPCWKSVCQLMAAGRESSLTVLPLVG